MTSPVAETTVLPGREACAAMRVASSTARDSVRPVVPRSVALAGDAVRAGRRRGGAAASPGGDATHSGPAPRNDVDLDAVGTATDVGLRRPRNEDAAAAAADGRMECRRRLRRRGLDRRMPHLAAQAAADVDHRRGAAVGRRRGGCRGGGCAVGPSLRCRPATPSAECGPRGPARWSWRRPPRSWPGWWRPRRWSWRASVTVVPTGSVPTGPAVLLTVDDSLARERIAEGMDPEIAFADPDAHTITRWLGADADGGDARGDPLPVTGARMGGRSAPTACGTTSRSPSASRPPPATSPGCVRAWSPGDSSGAPWTPAVRTM